MNKFCILTLALICNLTFLNAQNRYVIRFTDKNNSPFSLSQPQQYLSSRSINRRIKEGIAIDIKDIPVNQNYIQAVAATGAAILNVSKWFNAVIIETSDPNALTTISQLPYVANTNSVGRLANHPGIIKDKFDVEKIISSPYSSTVNQRSSVFNYNHSFNQINMIGLQGLQNSGFSGDGMIIAVLDAGFYDANNMGCFDSLFQNNGIISTYDFVDHETNVYNDNYHGASVLSCMAANVPGELIGTAPHAKYILLRSEDANSEYVIEEYNWSVAAEFADSIGADVINTSLGYTTFDDPSEDHTYNDLNGNTCPSSIAADIAAQKGILVVASAGNEGNSLWHYVSTPAEADSVLAVGAVDSLRQYASFSSTGPTADRRIKPDVADQGLQTWLYVPGNPDPQRGSGTSFSGPLMAGAVACLWQAWPNRNNMQIIDAVKKSASQYSSPDSLLGYGIPDFSFANNILSLQEFNLETSQVMHVFPNPWNGNDVLNIFFFSYFGEKAELTLMDISGKIILEKEPVLQQRVFNQIKLNEKISSGIYLIKIKSNDGTFVKKFVKQ